MRIVKLLMFCLAFHMALMATLVFINSEPVSDIRLTTRADTVIIFGKTRVGTTSVVEFSGWVAAQSYMSRRGIVLPTITHTKPGLVAPFDAHSEKTDTASKVVWVSGDTRGVLFAPDAQSAEILRDYVRYYGLAPSPFGFSLRLN